MTRSTFNPPYCLSLLGARATYECFSVKACTLLPKTIQTEIRHFCLLPVYLRALLVFRTIFDIHLINTRNCSGLYVKCFSVFEYNLIPVLQVCSSTLQDLTHRRHLLHINNLFTIIIYCYNFLYCTFTY